MRKIVKLLLTNDGPARYTTEEVSVSTGSPIGAMFLNPTTSKVDIIDKWGYVKSYTRIEK